MDASLLHLLRCPFCGGAFNPLIDPAGGALEYNVLTCHCSHYPVVAGIPILKKGIVADAGPTADELVGLIVAGRHAETLLALITPRSPTLAPDWIKSLPSVTGIRRLKRLAHQRAVREWRDQATSLLAKQEGRATACEALQFHFPEYYDYNAYRFGQPRHLVALSFCSVIQDPQRPVLDLACGCGHLTYSLIQRANGQPVIGVDQFFVGLYLARHWIAPAAAYVCCTADSALPFADGSFSSAFCSDAFHYFPAKTTCFRELERLTRDDGLIVLVWMHNADAGKETPNDLPLPPEGYQALAANLPHRLVSDSAVLDCYLQKRGPQLARPVNIDRLRGEPRLSLVASHREEVFQDYGLFRDWPHACGHLALNPLFVGQQRNANGQILLRRRYPSPGFEEGHAESRRYLPETVCISAATLADLESGARTPEIDHLIEQCVVLGMPERYL